jgi:hypothetical protein
VALSPGVPSGTGATTSRPAEHVGTAPTTHSAPNAEPDTRALAATSIVEAVAYYRRRLALPRSHRVNPCFSQAEWAALVPASATCRLTPGGFTAAAAVAFSRADRRGSLDDERRNLEALIGCNSALAAIGTRLNQLARYLNSGGTPQPDHAHRLLQHLAGAVTQADTAAAAIPGTGHGPETGTAGPSALTVDIVRQHRRRMPEPRRHRTHPCFSDGEWADLTAAARACRLKPGGYAAATALLAAHTPDPRAAIADTHRQLEELMASNRQLAAVGNNLNQLLVHLPTHGPLHRQTQRVLRLVHDALDHVDTAAAEIAWR